MSVESSNETTAPQAGAGAGQAGGAGKKKGKGWTVVFAVSLVVLVVSVLALVLIWFSYFQGQQKYDKLTENFTPSDDINSLQVDWAALLAINPDTVGWVYVPGTNINYPVVKGADNDYYLTHDFDGDAGWLANFGAIFMDYRNNPNWSDNAYFIYGHHMNDGSMFADVAGMSDQDFFNGCRTVYLLSPTGNFKMRSYALIHCAADDPIVQTSFATPEEMAAYVQDKMNRSVVDAGNVPAPAQIKKTFAFATCDNIADSRYVLYTYVESTTVDGLVGKLGTETNAEGETNIVDELEEKKPLA